MAIFVIPHNVEGIVFVLRSLGYVDIPTAIIIITDALPVTFV
jgi:hypothetical protein